MKRVFLVTGLNEGKEIDPYMLETDGNVPYIDEYGDMARYVDELSEAVVKDNLKNGIPLYLY
jgi:hypothetical protein